MRLVMWFALVAIAELATFVWVESMIGLGNALLIALATAVIGSALVRRAGGTVMTELRRRLAEGAVPGRELTHGAAILVAGALLISPGFVTDAVGFTLLVPAVRDGIHRMVARRLAGRVTTFGPDGVAYPSPAGSPEVIEVEGWEIEDSES